MAEKETPPKEEKTTPAPTDAAKAKSEEKTTAETTPIISEKHHPSVEKPTETKPDGQVLSSGGENFFAEFGDHSKGKKYRYILFAIFAILIAGVLFLIKPQLESYFKPQSNPENYVPVSQEPKSMHLVINNPDDEMLTFDKTINISGKTSPKSSIVISNGDLNWGVDASDQGEFAKVIDLKTGINNVIIYAFDPQGNSKVETRTIYYSEEKI